MTAPRGALEVEFYALQERLVQLTIPDARRALTASMFELWATVADQNPGELPGNEQLLDLIIDAAVIAHAVDLYDGAAA
ncbi:hypothetical protein [Aquisalimonas sp.]|uniref:hypothetical protein n=1 Tax=Aquisalimonas sp. TaxID=1872621 RepID=UPI0025C4C686|nr:hypothetical protein [Aquisalimonas sp.]